MLPLIISMIANVERKQTLPFVQSMPVSWGAGDIVPCRIPKAEPLAGQGQSPCRVQRQRLWQGSGTASLIIFPIFHTNTIQFAYYGDNIMKKITLLPLILTLTAAAGCGNTVGSDSGSSEAASAPATTAPAVTTEAAAETQPAVQGEDKFEFELHDGCAVVTKYTGNSADVTVPDEYEGAPVTEIGFYAFEAEFDIASVTLPETVTLIGEGAFMDCSSLTSINIPAAVTGIDRGAFVGCSKLGKLDIPESVGYIREEAFTGCGSMKTLNIMNPDIAYENWGLEELTGVTVYAPDGSAVLDWASERGIANDIL